MRPTLPLVAAGLALAACGDGGDSGDGSVGRFTVNFGEADAQIIHPSGLLLELAANETFAVRRASARYEMQFGSFLIEETIRDDWTPSAKWGAFTRRDGAVIVDVLDAQDEVLGIASFSEIGGSLAINFAASDPQKNRTRMRFSCDEAGGFLGFGAQTHDVDHRGQRVPVFVSEQGIGKVEDDVPHEIWFVVGTRHQSYLAVPTMLAPRATASYGLHATTMKRSIWDLCAADPNLLEVEAWEPQLEILVSAGPSPLDVIRQQTEHTGRAPAAPPWSLGVWMEAVGGRDAVLDEFARLRAERIPVSAIWTEDWRGGRQSGNQYILEEDWRLDESLYPGFENLLATLHDGGAKFLAYFNTFVVEDVDVWDEAVREGHLVTNGRGEPFLFQEADGETTALADILRPATADFVRGELENALALGIDGWMADFAEWYPADPQVVAPPEGLDAETAHHRYPVRWAELNREAVENSGRSDSVIFHRSGYTGSQSQVQVVWAGDQRTSFQDDDGLPTVVPIMIGLGVVGFPIATHDIAGYVSATNPNSDKELFFRWTSLGAWSPIMRTHHGREADFNWRWTSDAETIEHFREMSERHTRLYPYLRSLALEAYQTGAPLVRPMAFADPGDYALHGIKDQFLLGDSLVVAPVVTASTAVRSVSLPGGGWYDFASGDYFTRAGTVTSSAALTAIPVFVRAGAIVPMLPEGVESLVSTQMVTDLEDVMETRAVLVWLGARGNFAETDGGRYELESLRRPEAVSVESGQVLAEGERFVRVALDDQVRLEDENGSAHVFTRSESNKTGTVEFRW